MDGEAVGRHAGGLSGFGAPRAKIRYPSTSLTIGCGRHISGPPGSWAEVGLQGVPQTGKIIEVKKTTLRVLFFRSPRAWRFCLGLHGSVGCLRSAGDPHRHGKK